MFSFQRGRSQVYSLGRRIRSLYTGFIPDIYSTDDIISRSSYLDRTLMSGEGVLAGLYPPRGNQVWDHHLLWQPTVLYSDSPDNSLVSCQNLVFVSDNLSFSNSNEKRSTLRLLAFPSIDEIREYGQEYGYSIAITYPSPYFQVPSTH